MALRLSEVRQKLNELSALDKPTDEQRAEMRQLTDEYPTIEERHRAAITAETAEDEARKAGAEGADGHETGEGAELRRLQGRVALGDYLIPAAAGLGLAGGAAVELAAALEVPTVGPSGGVAIPWAALLEKRAYTTTTQNDGPEMQRPILQRLFGPSIMGMLGVRMDTIPQGRAEWPLFTTGVAPDQTKEGTAATAAVAATFTFATLKPKKIAGEYELTHEMLASVADAEGAVRRDLAEAVTSRMSHIVVNGSAPNTQNPQRIEGFIAKLGAATDLSTAEAVAADYGRLHSLGVDAIHAMREGDVVSIVGDETYQHSAGVYITGSGEAGSELLERRSKGCYASTYIPDKVSMKQSALLHAAGSNGDAMMRGDSVGGMWPTLEIIRDNVTAASVGIKLTWVGMWDVVVALRSAAYKHIAIHIG